MDISEIRREQLRKWFSNRSIPEKEKSYISQLLKGKASFGERAARRLERDYSMPDKFLDTPILEVSNDLQQKTPVMPGYCRLPILNTEAAAGTGCFPPSDDPQIITYVDVAEGYIRETLRSNPNKLQIITARGQSMSGIIEDGDILFVEPGNKFTNDGIYIISSGEWLRVKQLRLSVIEKRIFIESTDGCKESISFNEIDCIHICGRVVGSWSLKKF